MPKAGRRGNDQKAVEPGGDQLANGSGLAWMLQGLQNDPSLRLTESGRTLLRWIHSRAIRSNERLQVADQVPSHCTYIVANVARACADEWTQLANELEQRNSDSA